MPANASMTTLVARQPLQTLSMSSSQRGARRLSARLQEKGEAQPHPNGYHQSLNNQTPGPANHGTSTKRAPERPPANKKRRIDYDEEEDGFVFARAKTRKSRPSVSNLVSIPEQLLGAKENSRPLEAIPKMPNNDEAEAKEGPKRRKNKMSFSTPNVKAGKPVRRSQRLSYEAERKEGSLVPDLQRQDRGQTEDSNRPAEIKRPPERPKTPLPSQADENDDYSATKIALPFADTPVIRRNKAMREGKSGKGERRSSLGLRGRRASSLIESGNSNALPHSEVEVADFYKHIESEHLTEPRRMRQLLTWCATRAMEAQPGGLPQAQPPEYEDQSARLAARVIQEELLRDFANRSELSDWFGREDAQKAEEPLPQRPNPKNVQSEKRIEELEVQIGRLKSERHSLEALLRPPSTPPGLAEPVDSPTHAHPLSIDSSLLSGPDAAVLDSFITNPLTPQGLSSRINGISTSLGPTIDAFADGIHKMTQYRDMAERISDKVLSMCAQRLEERDREGRKRALAEVGDSSEDLKGVLRSLSRIDR